MQSLPDIGILDHMSSLCGIASHRASRLEDVTEYCHYHDTGICSVFHDPLDGYFFSYRPCRIISYLFQMTTPKNISHEVCISMVVTSSWHLMSSSPDSRLSHSWERPVVSSSLASYQPTDILLSLISVVAPELSERVWQISLMKWYFSIFQRKRSRLQRRTFVLSFPISKLSSSSLTSFQFFWMELSHYPTIPLSHCISPISPIFEMATGGIWVLILCMNLDEHSLVEHLQDSNSMKDSSRNLHNFQHSNIPTF